MAKLNIENTRTLLQDFRFGELFIEELNWSNPPNKATQAEVLKEESFTRKPIAELAGATVYEITVADRKIHALKAENLLIFIDKDRRHWEKLQEEGNKAAQKLHRDHFFLREQKPISYSFNDAPNSMTTPHTAYLFCFLNMSFQILMTTKAVFYTFVSDEQLSKK